MGLANKRQLFFAEQLELERGEESSARAEPGSASIPLPVLQPCNISAGQQRWNPEGSGGAVVAAGCLGAGIASLSVNTSMDPRMEHTISWAPAIPSSSQSLDGNSHLADPCLPE